MKTRLIWVLIITILVNALIPNFIYADTTKLDINTQDFGTIQNSYTVDSWNKYKDEGKADIKTENGSKQKQVKETFSLGSSLATAMGSWLMLPVTAVSILMTITTRGNKQLLIKDEQISEWNSNVDALIKGINGYTINWFTIEDTVFNRIELFEADYFTKDKNDNDVNKAVKNSVSIFYYITNIMALVLQMAMLIYLGIRMAISTIASEKAKYKDMLIDWLVSMILLFTLPYIMAGITMISEAIVEIAYSLKTVNGFEKSILWQATNLLHVTSGWSYVATIFMYIVITFYQLKFFLLYFYRFLSIGFLIVISPLITITYSASKTPISDGGKKKGKTAFNLWMEEYMVNAFIQPIHAVIYLVFIISANEIFKIAPFLSIIFFMSLSRAEKIVKNIFSMRDKSSIHSLSEYMPIKKK